MRKTCILLGALFSSLCLGFGDVRPDGLNPGEAALLRVFFGRPRFNYFFQSRLRTVQPYMIHDASETSDIYGWRAQLSAASFRRLVAVSPGLADLAEAGRAHRVNEVNQIIQRVDRELGAANLRTNFVEALLGSYRGLLNRNRVDASRPPPFIEGQAYAETLRRFNYAPSMSRENWSLDAQRFHRDRITELTNNANFQARSEILPERELLQWRNAELARLRRLLAAAQGQNLEGNSAEQRYRRERYEGIRESLNAAIRMLDALADNDQRNFVNMVTRESLAERQRVPSADTLFGPPATRIGGTYSPVVPGLEWLANLDWWGREQRADYWLNPRGIPGGWNVEGALNPSLARRRWLVSGAATLVGMGLAVLGYQHVLEPAATSFHNWVESMRPTRSGPGEGVPTTTRTEAANHDMANFARQPQVPLFRITRNNSAGHSVGEVELPYQQHLDLGPLTQIPNEEIRRVWEVRGDALVVPEQRRLSQRRAGELIPIPSTEGFLSVPDIIWEGNETLPNGQRRQHSLQIGRDFTVHRTRAGTLFVRLERDAPSTLFLQTVDLFAQTPPMPLPAARLSAREVQKLSEEITHLEHAGFTTIPSALRNLVDRGNRGGPVTISEIARVLQENTSYAKRDAHAGTEGIANPYSIFSNLLNESGVFEAVCRHSEMLLERILTRTMLDHPNLRFVSRNVFPFEHNERRTAMSPGHTNVVVIDTNRPGQRLTLEPTAQERAVQASPNELRISARPIRFPMGPVDLPPFYHRFRFRGQAIHVNERGEWLPLPLTIAELKDRVKELSDAQKSRNDIRTTALSALVQRLDTVGATQSGLGNVAENTRTPHQLALRLGVIVKGYVEGTLTSQAVFERISDLGFTVQATNVSVDAQVRDAIREIESRIEAFREATGGQHPLGRFISSEALAPVTSLLQTLREGNWSPMETVSRRAFAEEVLVEHAERSMGARINTTINCLQATAAIGG